MSSKTAEAIISIANFIRRRTPPLPFKVYYPLPFVGLMHECAKRNRSFANDFNKFLENFKPEIPKRGENVHGTGASKTDFGRQGYSGRRGYRLIYFYDEENRNVMLLDLYAKNEKTDINHEEARVIAEMVRAIKSQEIDLIPFT
jgi:mRNA-degrading endonuclease RelE of RelBE toxin-antitoxin system